MDFRVILSNVNKQHSYQTALAAYEAGVLAKFVTSLYYKPSRFPYSLVRNGKGLSHKDFARLRGRRQEGLPDEVVVSVALPEIVEQVMARAAPEPAGGPSDTWVSSV